MDTGQSGVNGAFAPRALNEFFGTRILEPERVVIGARSGPVEVTVVINIEECTVDATSFAKSSMKSHLCFPIWGKKEHHFSTKTSDDVHEFVAIRIDGYCGIAVALSHDGVLFPIEGCFGKTGSYENREGDC